MSRGGTEIRERGGWEESARCCKYLSSFIIISFRAPGTAIYFTFLLSDFFVKIVFFLTWRWGGNPGETGERKERGCPCRVGVGGIPDHGDDDDDDLVGGIPDGW